MVYFILCHCLLQLGFKKLRIILFELLLSATASSAICISEAAVLHFYGLLAEIALEAVALLAILCIGICSCDVNKQFYKFFVLLNVILTQILFKLIYFCALLLIAHTNIGGIYAANTEYRIIFLLITNFISLLTIYTVNEIIIQKRFYLIFYPISICCILFVPLGLSSNEHIQNMNYLLIIIVSIIIIASGIPFLLRRIQKNHSLKIQNKLIKQEQLMYMNQIKEANRYIEEIAKIKHDMKNNIFCISELISDSNTEAAIQICEKINNELNNIPHVFHSGNIYLDSILNVICKKAKERNIDIKISLKTDLKNIDGTDLISLLGNLSDNAIEAIDEDMDRRNIIISIFEKGDSYIISVKNDIPQSVLEYNNSLRTSKPDSIYHGIGLRMVNSIVKRYNGFLDITEENDMFIINIMLKIPSITI